MSIIIGLAQLKLTQIDSKKTKCTYIHTIKQTFAILLVHTYAQYNIYLHIYKHPHKYLYRNF